MIQIIVLNPYFLICLVMAASIAYVSFLHGDFGIGTFMAIVCICFGVLIAMEKEINFTKLYEYINFLINKKDI